jgi:hypothetical protein
LIKLLLAAMDLGYVFAVDGGAFGFGLESSS